MPSNGKMTVKEELEKIWKEAIMAYVRYYHSIYLQELRITIKNLSQDSRHQADK
jgi:hypothetical protein